jgi:hypothetical protein
MRKLLFYRRSSAANTVFRFVSIRRPINAANESDSWNDCIGETFVAGHKKVGAGICWPPGLRGAERSSDSEPLDERISSFVLPQLLSDAEHRQNWVFCPAGCFSHALYYSIRMFASNKRITI